MPTNSSPRATRSTTAACSANKVSARLRQVMSDRRPSCTRPWVWVEHQRNIVEDPDDAAILADHAVLGEVVLGCLGQRVFSQQDTVAILGVQPPLPQVLVGEELLWGEAQDVLDLRADIEPGAVLAAERRVDGSWEPIDETLADRLGERHAAVQLT